MSENVFVTSLNQALRWARSSSFWYVSTGSGCCADEIFSAMGCRYDLERFGSMERADPRQADLLIVNGMVSYKAAPHLQEVYRQMNSPKYVMAVGACASRGGPYSPCHSYSVVPGIDKILPVDVYVAGCPPRPEAIMNGLITLQEKVFGSGVH